MAPKKVSKNIKRVLGNVNALLFRWQHHKKEVIAFCASLSLIVDGYMDVCDAGSDVFRCTPKDDDDDDDDDDESKP
jgi:hypothetical protein